MSDFSGVMADTSAADSAPPAASTPSASETAASPSAPASASSTPASEGSTDSTKPLPQKHEEAVPFARFHEVNSALGELKSQYGWLPKEHVATLQQFWQGYQADPAAALVAELEFLASHPQYQPTVRSAAAKLLGMRGEPKAEPDPDYVTPDGVSLNELIERRARKLLEDEIGPIKKDYSERRAAETLAAQRSDALATAQKRMATLAAMPHFTDHKAAIHQLYTTKYTKDAGYGAVDGLYAAYNDVLTNVVLPKIGQTERTTVLSSLQQKAGASSVNPGRPALTPPLDTPKDFRAALVSLGVE